MTGIFLYVLNIILTKAPNYICILDYSHTSKEPAEKCFKHTVLILRKNWAEIITTVKHAVITLEGILYSVYTGCRSLQKALESP